MARFELLTVLLTLAGAAMLLLALAHTARVLQLLGASRHQTPWRALFGLQFCFFVGYLAVCGLVLFGATTLLAPLAGVVFAAGALFVLLVVRVGAATIVELQSARAAAETTSRARSIVLANLSHELRTPLNTIIGYSDLLLEAAAEGRRVDPTDDLQQIRQAGAHLLGLIDEILDHARLEAGRLDLHPAPVDLPALIEGVAAAATPLAARNRNRLTVSVAPGLPALVADEARLRQILLNLLANACKFTEDGEVSLQVRGDGEHIRFVVADTGIGMSAEQLATIFRPFVQAVGHTLRRHGGTGLGLTIAQQLAHLMGGAITVTSAVGQGSRFTVSLPAAAATLAPLPSPPARTAEGNGETRFPHASGGL